MNEEIALLTATGDREIAFGLCVKWMLEQTYEGDIHWIIVDDGFTKATEKILDKTQFDKRFRVQAIKRIQEKDEAGARSMAQNILIGSAMVKENLIIVIEDDDWYSPQYLKDMINRLQKYDAVGTIWQNYYFLPDKTYRTYKNRGSALCSTGFQRVLLPYLRESAHRSYKKNLKGLDAYFWQEVEASKKYKIQIFDNKKHLMIGMKGLPGREGIGIGHHRRRHSRWLNDDSEASVLRDWVGEKAAQIYLQIRQEHLI